MLTLISLEREVHTPLSRIVGLMNSCILVQIVLWLERCDQVFENQTLAMKPFCTVCTPFGTN